MVLDETASMRSGGDGLVEVAVIQRRRRAPDPAPATKLVADRNVQPVMSSPMITKVHSASVVVADQDAALDFYVDTLGWEKRADAPVSEDYRWLTVAPVGGDAEVALEPPGISNRKPGDTPASPWTSTISTRPSASSPDVALRSSTRRAPSPAMHPSLPPASS